MNKLKTLLVSTAAAMLLQAGVASAVIITYDLSDKAPGALADPDYGLRLDDLFSDPTESNWTFSFDDPGASVQMDIDTDAATVRIHGTVIGGRDSGSEWAAETTAIWELDFTYSHLVTINDASTGYWSVAESADNFGWLRLVDEIDLDGIAGTDEGRYIALGDYHGGSFVANAGPAPSGPYVSAWLESTDGFIDNINNLIGETYVRPNGDACCKDFGYRATSVPEPTSLALMSLGLFGLGFNRRKRLQ